MKKWKLLPLCLATVMATGVCFAGCGDDEGGNEGGNGGGSEEEIGSISGGQGTVNAELVKQLAVKVPEKTAKGLTIDVDASVTTGGHTVDCTGVMKANLETGNSEAALKMTRDTATDNQMYLYTFTNAAGAFMYESETEVTTWNNTIELDYEAMEDIVPTEGSELNPMALASDLTVYNSMNYEILALSTKTALVKQDDTGYIVTVALDQTVQSVIGDISAIVSRLTTTSKLNDLLNDVLISSYIDDCFGLVKAKTIYDLVDGMLSGAPATLDSDEPDMEGMMELAAAMWAALPAPAEADSILGWLKKIADVDASKIAPNATGKLGDLTLGNMGLTDSMNLSQMWKEIADNVLEKLDYIEKAEVVLTFDTNKNFVGQTVEFSVKDLPLEDDEDENSSGDTLTAASEEETEAAKTVTASGTLTFTYSATAPEMTDISACKVSTPTSMTFTGHYSGLEFSFNGERHQITFAKSGNKINVVIMQYDSEASGNPWTEVGREEYSTTFTFGEEFTSGDVTLKFEYDEYYGVELSIQDPEYGDWSWYRCDNILNVATLSYSTVGELLAD